MAVRRAPTAEKRYRMDFGFSEEQEMLRKSARDFLAKESPMTYVRQMMEDDRGFTDAQWKKMAELGWMGLILPEQYGGAAHVVDLLVVAGRAPGSKGAEGVSLFLVDAKSPGITTTLLKTMDQTRKLCEVVLQDVSVPADRVLGEPGKGWKLLEAIVDRGKVGICAEMCGGAARVL